jgi:hypothetical protein
MQVNGSNLDLTLEVFNWQPSDPQEQPNLDHVIALIGALLEHKQNIINALEYARGSHTFDDVAMRVLSGQSTLWVEGSSFAITELIDSPKKRSLHLFLAGGNREDMYALHLRMIKWARQNGVVEATLSGRVGWLRILEHMGWEEKHRTLSLDLSKRLPFEEQE